MVPVRVDRRGGRKVVRFLTKPASMMQVMDYDDVADWCLRWPDCGWAIPTGDQSFLALDIDPGGHRSMGGAPQRRRSSGHLPGDYAQRRAASLFRVAIGAEIKSRVGILEMALTYVPRAAVCSHPQRRL